jgi:hypothetical protein
MKKITIQFICLAMVMMTLSVTETFAQQIRLKDGKATVRATIGANSEKTYTISGKDFQALNIKKTNRVSFRYELRLGTELISSGQTMGLSLEVESDNRSTYSIKIINESNAARRIVLGFQQTGGGSPTV